MNPLAPPATPTPPVRRPRSFPQRLYAFLVSPKLAIALLIGVLACCIVGVTFFPYPRSSEVIFGTLWFNGLLVLLAISSAAAFFTRIWKRKLTLVSVGLILFHLSFLALLGGVAYRGLFYFRGVMRLTEGETLPNGQLESYDQTEAGRFFDFERLPGETTLVRMHRGYKVGGDDKRAAYEIEVGKPDAKTRSIIYITEYLDLGGVRYFCSKEGYTVLVVMNDKEGKELYGAFVPLQSIRQANGSHVYATGSATEASSFPFPQPPEHPRAELQVTFWPSLEERAGQIGFQVKPTGSAGAPAGQKSGMVYVGEPFDAGEFVLTPREIRYWVGMDVRYDPGWSVIMASLGFGLGGMVLILAGRLRQGTGRKKAA